MNFSTANATTTSIFTLGEGDGEDYWKGFIGALVSVVFFGSCYVPVKKNHTGDGMFYQWVFCSAIWMCGFVINWIQNFPPFYSLAMIGGCLFAIGNICVVPIINTIGLALGMLIWCSLNLLTGWTTGRFGIFGISPQVPNYPTINYVSIGFALISTLIWFFVRPDVADQKTTSKSNDERKDAENDSQCSSNLIKVKSSPEEEKSEVMETNSAASWLGTLSPGTRNLIGIMLSITSGMFYGVSFIPTMYIKQFYPGASQNDLDYVFAHFTGIIVTSFFLFLIYCIATKNQPKLHASVVLPGMLSGAMWAVADAAWFLSNRHLSAAISFPIITTVPGVIASIWGVMVFKEIKGRRNMLIMASAYLTTAVAAILAGLSRRNV